MIMDTHCHGQFSADSKATLEAFLEEAKKKNIGFILTDHMDLHGYKDDTFVFDPEEYFSAFEGYRSEDVGLGIELGLRAEAKSYYEKIVKDYPFDYLLGSVHAPYRSYDDLEFTYRRLHESVIVDACYRYYWENVIHALEENPYINSLSHVDYIARYHQDLYKGDIPFESILDLMQRAFMLLVEQDISLEINTARLRDPLAIEQWKTILSIYSRLGGRDVTLGSDAHRSTDLGRNFDVAVKLAKEFGLKIVSFHKQKKKILF